MSAATPWEHLPPLAGLCTLEEAARPGLSVEACVARLKRFHYAFKQLHGILTARITAEPVYELKMAFSHHAYLCTEHAAALRTRVGEMREPPLGLDDVPHPALEVFFDEILAALTTAELIDGLYAVALPALDAALERYAAKTNALTDAPSRRLVRFARLELADMIAYGRHAVTAFGETQRTNLDELLAQAGTLDGTGPTSDGPPVRVHSAKPYQFDPVPQRDGRFEDLWNQGVNPEAFLYAAAFPARAKVLMMLYKRLREIDVPEVMAGIITETPGKPWGYYRDMSRQLWDEARHAMMGQVGFTALGVDWTACRVTWNWSYRLNTECTPAERHAVLFFIEQGLMPKIGKRYEYETAVASGLPLAATMQDFDWADEVLHAQIGRQWYVPQFGTLKMALEYGDQAWSRILSNWATVKKQGLTAHANWWPAVYSQACAAAGDTPDPAVSGYATTYEGCRADLKTVGG